MSERMRVQHFTCPIPMMKLRLDVKVSITGSLHGICNHLLILLYCADTPTPTPHVRIPEKDISHVYLGGYLQPVVVLIIGVLLGLVWWVYNSYF